jgi:hypothetical protein
MNNSSVRHHQTIEPRFLKNGCPELYGSAGQGYQTDIGRLTSSNHSARYIFTLPHVGEDSASGVP